MYDLDRHIKLIQNAIKAKSSPLKVILNNFCTYFLYLLPTFGLKSTLQFKNQSSFQYAFLQEIAWKSLIQFFFVIFKTFNILNCCCVAFLRIEVSIKDGIFHGPVWNCNPRNAALSQHLKNTGKHKLLFYKYITCTK